MITQKERVFSKKSGTDVVKVEPLESCTMTRTFLQTTEKGVTSDDSMLEGNFGEVLSSSLQRQE